MNGWLLAEPLDLDDQYEVVWRVNQECDEPSANSHGYTVQTP
jgi:hypothetical protein